MLNYGDKIGIVWCSDGQKHYYAEKLKCLETTLRNMGLQPVFSNYIYEKENIFSGTAKERIRQLGEDTGIARAKEVTTQRLAVFDLSVYGAFAPYYAAGGEDGVAYTFGAGWEGARTAENIVMLNSAVENGYYTYLFDRCIAMGADTVLFVIEKLQNGSYDIERVVETGASFGFEFVEQSKTTLLLHKEVPETFGVINEYEYLTIGRAAKDIAYLFPSFKEGEDTLDAYTLEKLCAYKRIFLSDFTYKRTCLPGQQMPVLRF